MKKTLATALALVAFAGTAVAQEAYGHRDFGNASPNAVVSTQQASSADRADRTDRGYTVSKPDALTTASIAQSNDQKPYPDHRFRWDQDLD